MIIQYKITNDIIDKASTLYEFNNLNGSITEGKSQIFGAIGEMLIFNHFNDECIFESTYDYDMIVKGYKVDVKTKKVNTYPQDFHYASVSSFNTNQKCDYYFFCRVLSDMSLGYMCGYILKTEFYDKAVFKKKGDKDWNGWEFKDDCYNLRLDELHHFKDKNI